MDKPLYSALPPDVIKAILLVSLADGIVALSYGSLAGSLGFPLWVPLALSLLVMAGASEFIFIGMVAGGGSPLAAAAAGLLVNARHIPFGIAVRDLVGHGRRSIVGSHIMNDESVMFGLSQPDRQQQRAAFWLCGIGIAICWPGGVLAGLLIGRHLPDPGAIGLDAVFPAIMLALVIPALKKRDTRRRAGSGALLALLTVPWLPVGLPVLISLAGVALRGKKNDQ
ncbi:AzlC family ABC transporter permease [Tatumella citrea]|uniref:Branched-chain amino acid ABC transporter permease n=1 Tax=Tatumella citrea TaxID=53336 RepID=A0A1Y0LNY0_TATCI|nr:AzlC family ABC transporter permease [Tatumella citrea]ARU95654.1 branched-chain amino acid ABC transporter permease [Tatumella citrea]ARU99695.1 branched-chain amino acid ABC transporter permease [Tatumella citrea]